MVLCDAGISQEIRPSSPSHRESSTTSFGMLWVKKSTLVGINLTLRLTAFVVNEYAQESFFSKESFIKNLPSGSVKVYRGQDEDLSPVVSIQGDANKIVVLV